MLVSLIPPDTLVVNLVRYRSGLLSSRTKINTEAYLSYPWEGNRCGSLCDAGGCLQRREAVTGMGLMTVCESV